MFPVWHWIWILYVWIKRGMSPHSVLHQYIRPYRIGMFVALKIKAPIAKQTLPIPVCEILKASLVKFWYFNQPTAFFLEGSVVRVQAPILWRALISSLTTFSHLRRSCSVSWLLCGIWILSELQELYKMNSIFHIPHIF